MVRNIPNFGSRSQDPELANRFETRIFLWIIE